MSTYADVLARLVTARRFGIVFGLERMRALLDKLGAPDTRMGQVIHVGGTNGKGSTVAMIAHVARTAGLRVAAYTSPHLTELRERIAIDGAPIAYTAFAAAADRVARAGGDELTFFEQVTAIACVAIADATVDVTVLEVGLGGRLDATNAIAADVAVVTGVAMDHEAILGDTLAKIAAEKAGIFKRYTPSSVASSSSSSSSSSVASSSVASSSVASSSVASSSVASSSVALSSVASSSVASSSVASQSRPQRIVIGASGLPDAVPWLIDAARAVGVEPVVVDDAMIARVPSVALAGAHQRANAACALAAIDALADGAGHDAAAIDALADGAGHDAAAIDALADVDVAVAPTPREQVAEARDRRAAHWRRLVDPDTRARALSSVVHPGRFEIVRDAWIYPATAIDISLGDVILDGAHNPQGAAALATVLRERGTRPTLVLAVSADKDVRAIVRELLPAVGDVIATRYQQERAMLPADLARVVASVSAEDHLATVSSVPGKPDIVIVTKSEITDNGELVGTVDNHRTCHVEPDLVHALLRAAELVAPVLVAGSLFLVGEARTLLVGAPTDPILATDPSARK